MHISKLSHEPKDTFERFEVPRYTKQCHRQPSKDENDKWKQSLQVSNKYMPTYSFYQMSTIIHETYYELMDGWWKIPQTSTSYSQDQICWRHTSLQTHTRPLSFPSSCPILQHYHQGENSGVKVLAEHHMIYITWIAACNDQLQTGTQAPHKS